MSRWWLAVAVLASALGVAGCGDDDDEGGTTPTAVHWGYEGDVGPEEWGELSEEYAACATGREQSPIDLAAARAEDAPELAFEYETSDLVLQNNGHTVQATYDEGSELHIGDRGYELVQFHFHAGSEHTIGGERFPLEMHLVHRDSEGQLAVVGVLFERGDENAAYADIVENLPEEESEAQRVGDVRVNALELLPADAGHFAYEGSLTTPPCSEGVAWFVMSERVELSEEQIESFRGIFEGNYRPVQEVHGREVVVDEE